VYIRLIKRLARAANLEEDLLMPSVARAAITAVIRVLIVVCAVLTAQVANALTFVGRVEGSDAYIAVSKDGRKVGGYLCDNGTISRWIEYSWIENGSAPLTAGTTGELLGSVHFINNKAVGTVEIDGQTLHFSAKRVHGAGAGLFFAIGKQDDRLLVAGWILDPDGTQRGAVSRINMRTVSPLPVSAAPTLDPKKPTIEIGGETGVPPVVTEPQQLVVINIIAILIALLVPAVQ